MGKLVYYIKQVLGDGSKENPFKTRFWSGVEFTSDPDKAAKMNKALGFKIASRLKLSFKGVQLVEYNVSEKVENIYE